MEMKQYLIDTFTFNDLMNAKLLAKIKALPNQQQCIKFFSHLINSQKKWMVRIIQYPQDPKMDWWEPVYRLDELENEWRIEKSRKMREGERRERGDMPDPSSVHLRRCASRREQGAGALCASRRGKVVGWQGRCGYGEAC
jgi:hypothetical protein